MKVDVQLKNLSFKDDCIFGQLVVTSSEKLPKASFVKIVCPPSDYLNKEQSFTINLHSFSTVQSYAVEIKKVKVDFLSALKFKVNLELHLNGQFIELNKLALPVTKFKEPQALDKQSEDVTKKEQRLKQKRLLNKIVFVINGSEIFNHYGSTIKMLPPEKGALLVARPSHVDMELVKSFNIDFYSLSDLREQNIYFSIAVSNHYYASHGYPMDCIGKIHVRFSYALGKTQWNVSNWNKYYQAILCWGPYHKELYSKFDNAELIEIGYPRMDSVSVNNVSGASEISSETKNILWLPTSDELCSINSYIDSIEALSNKYNIVIKPHILSFDQNADAIEKLRNINIKFIEGPVNNAELIANSDLILADYGGSPFAAIYLGKKLILLNVKGASEHRTTGKDSLDIELRKYVPNIDEPSQLERTIENKLLWYEFDSTLKQLQKRFFYKIGDGKAGQRAAEFLLSKLNSIDFV